MTNTARAQRPAHSDWVDHKPVLYRRESSELSVIDDSASSVSALTLDGTSSLSDPWDTVEREEALGQFDSPELQRHDHETDSSFQGFNTPAATDDGSDEASVIVNSADTLLQMPNVDCQQEASILSALFDSEVEIVAAPSPRKLKTKNAAPNTKSANKRPLPKPQSFGALALKVLLDAKPLTFVLFFCSMLYSLHVWGPYGKRTVMFNPICQSETDWATVPLSQPTTLLAAEAIWNNRTAWTFDLPAGLGTKPSDPCLNIKLRDNRGRFVPVQANYTADLRKVTVQEAVVLKKHTVEELWIFTNKEPLVNARLVRKPQKTSESRAAANFKDLVNSTRLAEEANKLWKQEKVFWQGVKVDAAEALKRANEQAEVFVHHASVAISDLARQTELFRQRSAVDLSKKSARAARWLEKRYVKSMIQLQLMERTVAAQLQQDYQRISGKISKFMAKRKLNKTAKRQQLRTKELVKGFQEAWQRKVREIQKGFLKAGWRLNALIATKPLSKSDKSKSRKAQRS